MTKMELLHGDLNIRQTLRIARLVEQEKQSRFWLGSPCKFVRSLDLLIHLIIRELVEDLTPAVARYLRHTSPRWGRSWRGWAQMPDNVTKPPFVLARGCESWGHE